MPSVSRPHVPADALSCPTDRNDSDRQVEARARKCPDDPSLCNMPKAAKADVEAAVEAVRVGDLVRAISVLNALLERFGD